MKPIPLTARFSVAGQPQLTDFAEYRRLGYTTIINTRPDGEDPTQLGSTVEFEAAKAAGLNYVYIPVIATSISATDLRRFNEAIASSEEPVLAHCRSGTRAFHMWVRAGQADLEGISNDRLIAMAASIGIDPNAASTWLADGPQLRHEIEEDVEPLPTNATDGRPDTI